MMPMYEILNRNNVSNYIIQDAICKGYSIHSSKCLELWELLLNCLLECFQEEFGEIKIINKVPQLLNSNLLYNFYEDHFCRIEDRIPIIIDDEGNRIFVTTDELPFLFSNLNKGNALFSTYTVVRPRSFAVKPYLREEFIRYFQFVFASRECELGEVIKRVKLATNRFFLKIRMPVVLVDRHSDSYYSTKSCFHSVWMNGNIESVLQCGLLRKRFVTSSNESKFVIDVGGAQRLLAAFIFANSDSYGLFLPHSLRDYDVIVRQTDSMKLLDQFKEHFSKVGGRIKIIRDDIRLKKIKRISIKESAVAIIVQRRIKGNDFLTIYNRDMTKTDIHIDNELQMWRSKKYVFLDKAPYYKQNAIIQSKIHDEKLFFKSSNKSYAVIRDGLFA